MHSAYMKSKSKNHMQEPEVITELQSMLSDKSFRTLPGYSINTTLYPDHSVPFINDHLNYLTRHPKVDPADYLSNLRLMLKIR